MRLLPLQSSQIVGLAYEDDTLYVLFNNGSWYKYDDVPEHIVLQVILAESQGKMFDQKIKKGNYPYEKLDYEPDVTV